jgi:hypothetical protein
MTGQQETRHRERLLVYIYLTRIAQPPNKSGCPTLRKGAYPPSSTQLCEMQRQLAHLAEL